MKCTLYIKVLLLCLFATNPTMAGRQWWYQRVESFQGESLAGGSSAIAMRSNHAWPVVMSTEGAAAMVPGGWIETGPEMYSNYQFRIDAATSYDGQQMLFVNNNGAVSTFCPAGWNQSYVPSSGDPYQGGNSAAFTRNNEPAVLSQSWDHSLSLSVQRNGSWQTTSLGQHIQANRFALTYDSLNQANVAFIQGGSLVYGTNGVLTNDQWSYTRSEMYFPFQSQIDLELTQYDVPYIAFSDGQMLNYTTYDRQVGKWTTGVIDAMGHGYSNYCMKSDMQGGIGIAYVAEMYDGPRLGFAYTDGSGGWTTELLPNEILDPWGSPTDTIFPIPPHGIGLAFDEQNNPIISFSHQGEVWIAYDPIVVPEPATLSLLAFGGLALLRKRK